MLHAVKQALVGGGAQTRLKDIQKDLLAQPIVASKIVDQISGIDLRRNWDGRIVACILGVQNH